MGEISIWYIILFSAAAAIIGNGIGALISGAIGKRSNVITCLLLAFAGGIMIAVVCFGLIPEAAVLSNTYITFAGIIAGILIIILLNKFVDLMTPKKTTLAQAPLIEPSQEQSTICSKRLLRSGILILVAITLHNIPEGIAIGASGAHDMKLGITLAIIIAIHNVPEGIAVATPLICGGMKNWKAITLATLSGTPTILGCVLGVLIGNISSIAIAISLAAAGGAMLYIVFAELLSQSLNTKSRITPLIALTGVIIGFLIVQI